MNKNSLFKLEENISFTDVGTKNRDLINNLSIVKWIDDNEDLIPAKELLRRNIITNEKTDFDLYNLYSYSGNTSLFKSSNLKKMDKRDVLIKTWKSIIEFKTKKIFSPKFSPELLTKSFIAQLLKTSTNPERIVEVKDILLKIGIILIIEESFPQLGVDGVVFKKLNGNPVIGISLRYDRLDNFWFTLVHELSHIYLHYDILETPIVEDLDNYDSLDSEEIEEEANYFASDCIVDKKIWRRCDLRKSKSLDDLRLLAEKLEIHPSIIAGKIRYDLNDFTLFNDLVHEISVRRILL